MGAIAIKGAIEKINLDPVLIDEVYMGNVLQAGVGQAPARQSAIFAGIPDTVPATTVNKVCASGMKSISMAAQSLKAGDGRNYGSRRVWKICQWRLINLNGRNGCKN